jgi:hypothetical protein
MFHKHIKKLINEIFKPIKASRVHRELFKEFENEYGWYLKYYGVNMDLKDYMINAYLTGNNLRKIIDTIEEEVKRELPLIISNSCDDIYVEYMDYDNKSVVRIVLDCSNKVEKDIQRLLDDFGGTWYTDNHYDYGLSFCMDLNPENIEKFNRR